MMVTDSYTFAVMDGSVNYSIGGVCDSGMIIFLPSCFTPCGGPVFTFSGLGDGSHFSFVEELRERISGLLITVSRITGAIPRIFRRAAMAGKLFRPPMRNTSACILKKSMILRL